MYLLNKTNKCEHEFMTIVSAHFVTNENCYVDYHWCKKCGTVEAVKTYDESFLSEWTPDDYFILRARRIRNVELIEKGLDSNYDYYDGPACTGKSVPCEDCTEKECYYYAGNMRKEKKK